MANTEEFGVTRLPARGSHTEPDFRVPETPSVRVMRAYQDYFDMGAGRAIKKLWERYNAIDEEMGDGTAPTRSLPTLYAWSRRWNWNLQARIDESELYHQRRASRLATAQQIGERQSSAARVLQSIGMKKIQTLVNPAGELSESGLEMTPAEARRFLLEGAKMERELFGGVEIQHEGQEISYE